MNVEDHRRGKICGRENLKANGILQNICPSLPAADVAWRAGRRTVKAVASAGGDGAWRKEKPSSWFCLSGYWCA
jgi:hypothetical protein